MRVRAKPKSYKEREYLACARKCITSCSSARGTCQSMHVACTNCMHGSGDDDEVAAAAAAIQHAIVEQQMLQLPKMFSAALQCDVAHLHKILLHCMRNQAACFAYVQAHVPWEVEVASRMTYQIQDAVLHRNRDEELDRDAHAHLHGLGICQTPYEAEHNHPADADPDVDLGQYLYVNCGGIFTAGHDVNDRYNKRLYNHGTMVVSARAMRA